jgi:hypothetical protein
MIGDRREARFFWPMRALTAANWLYRRASAVWRALPDFIVIGAPRCGTSSLYKYLSEHPDVLPAFRKELHFFDRHYIKGLFWYRSNLPLIRRLGGVRITGEATPNYLVHPYVPDRIRSVIPNVKLIVLLRNPIDRTHSAWQHNQRRGEDQLSLEDALAAENARVSGDLERLGRGEEFQPRNYLRYSYLGKSRYAEHLDRWLEVFGGTQLLICKSEDVFSGNNDALSAIHAFLGITYSRSYLLPTMNASDRPPLNPEIRGQLADYFDPHNRKLYELVGRDFEWA